MAIDATKRKRQDWQNTQTDIFASWYFPADILFQVKETDREEK